MKVPLMANGAGVTVSTMRRHLAQVLSKLKGTDMVYYNFKAEIFTAKPTPNFPKGD